MRFLALFPAIGSLLWLADCSLSEAEKTERAAEVWPQYEAVARIFTTKAGWSVDPFDPNNPYTIRVHIANATLSGEQARKLAKQARERFHPKGIVRLYDDTGKLIGEATPWGVGP